MVTLTLFLLSALSFLQGWYMVAALLVVIFSLRVSAVYLIPLAIILDGYYGNFYSLPLLSLGSVWWYLSIEFLKPRLKTLKFAS